MPKFTSHYLSALEKKNMYSLLRIDGERKWCLCKLLRKKTTYWDDLCVKKIVSGGSHPHSPGVAWMINQLGTDQVGNNQMWWKL